MLSLRADGIISNLMWLGRYEGRLSTNQASLDQEGVSWIIRTSDVMAKAFAPEAPASEEAYKAISALLKKGTTNVALCQSMDRARIVVRAEMAQRKMYILMPGQSLPKNDQPALPEPVTGLKGSSGGRPPKAFWEDLWAEIARQLYEGDLKPDKQVDIENAMNIWLDENGHLAGETQVRERARKLFKTISK